MWKQQKNFNMFQKIIQFSVPFLYIFSIFTITATAQFSEYENFLKTVTQENGVFESLSVLWLFSIFLYGTLSLYNYRNLLNKPLLLLIGAVSLLALLAALEEISWGQHLFHFESHEYFLENNMQKETNIHNFVNANLFSSIIYVSIYILFVFIPLLYKTFFKDIPYLRYFDINMHYILIILFSSTLQIYFYNDFGVYMDMTTHIIALAFVAYVIFRKQSTMLLKIHYFTVLTTTVLFMSQYGVFGFFNMQYEIREMFVALAVLLMFMAFIQKEVYPTRLKRDM